MQIPQLTVQEVLNLDTWEKVEAEEFFSGSTREIIEMRSELQKAISGNREPLLVCAACKQKVRIRGRRRTSLDQTKKETFHFAHLKDSDDCPIKTDTKYTKDEVDRMRYNGAKESKEHYLLKHQIANGLRANQEQGKGVSEVEVEAVVKHQLISKEWKKPDISGQYKAYRIAIELQLSTTWLDVITQRQLFYPEQGIFMFWVFNDFVLDEDKRKLAFTDVVYTNNQNAFIFDREAQEKSKEAQDLILRCRYLVYDSSKQELTSKWKEQFVSLDDLSFDHNTHKVYYFNSNASQDAAQKFIEAAKKEEERLERIRQQEEKQRRIKEREMLDEWTEQHQKLEELRNRKANHEARIKKIERAKPQLELQQKNVDAVAENTAKYLGSPAAIYMAFENIDLRDFTDEYSPKYEKLRTKIFDARDQIMRIDERLSNSSILERLEAVGRTFRILDPYLYENFLLDNAEQVCIIPKDKKFSLFKDEEVRTITNQIDLQQMLQSKNHYLFLFDFESNLKELENKKRELEGTISMCEAKLELLPQILKETIKMKTAIRLEGIPDEIIEEEKQIAELEKEIEKEVAVQVALYEELGNKGIDAPLFTSNRALFDDDEFVF